MVSISQTNGIAPLRSSITRYLLSKSAEWIKNTYESGEITGFTNVHPPLSVAKCILDQSDWKHIRKLRGVSPFPPLSADGKIRTEEGYDKETQVYFLGGVACQMSERPNKKQAQDAATFILNLVIDFPFASQAHRSAWLAGLLSPLVRFAHDGNHPITVVQANSPRVGKTTLVKLISYIVNGEDCPVITHTKNEDEERKRILSYLRKGRTLTLIDNVVGQFGGPGINAMITSRIFEDRILGGSKIVQAINDTTWSITGNHISLAPDTAERCLHIRLHSEEEHPHLRNEFRHNVFDLVKAKREQFLSAALTILQAYILAGKPDQHIPGWGSFESWSALVRSAIVWIGLPDPSETREELEAESDTQRSVALDLIEGWHQMLQIKRSEDGMTAKEVITALLMGCEVPRLRAAMEEISKGKKTPNAHQLGRHLRDIKDRNFGGKMLKCLPDKTGHRWFVVEAAAPTSTT